jgi:hypothetical protein
MNRITLLALGFLSLGIATSASAQTKVTQLIVQNAAGTTKLSQITSTGVGGSALHVDNNLILQRPGTTSTVTLSVPSIGAANINFDFPSTGGTLLTSAANSTNGSAIIGAINQSNLKINAANLDLTGFSSGVQTVAAGDLSLNISGTSNVTATLNTANANTWTATQTFPTTLAQGNALIAAINAGTAGSLTGYVTNTSLTSTLANYATTSAMNTAISNAVSGSSSTPGVTSQGELTASNTALSSAVNSNRLVLISSNQTSSGAPQSRAFTLPNGSTAGHTIFIHNSAGYCQLGGTNVLLKTGTTVNFGVNSALTLVWNGSDKWIEVSRSL